MKRKFNHEKVFKLVVPLIICLLFLSFLHSSEASATPKLMNGKLNLQSYSIEEIGPVSLEGEWKFYWKELHSYGKDPINKPKVVSVPSNWHEYTFSDRSPSQYGYATYQMMIQFNVDDVGEIVSLYMPSVATAYNLWINDALVVKQGIVATSKEDMTPKNYPQVVTFQIDQPYTEITLHVSNFHQRKSGLWEPILFGTDEQITNVREKNILFQMFVVGSIFIIGFYHIVLYFQRPNYRAPLYLALTCFAITIRTLLLKDTLLIYLFPQLNWELTTTLEYLAAIIAIIFFLLFVKEGLSMKIPNALSTFFVRLLTAYSLFIIVTPARIFTNTYVILQTIVILIMLVIVWFSVVGVWKKKEGSFLNAIAMFVLFIVILNDLFYYSNRISSDELVSVGLLFYLFIQSIHLARQFSQSFNHVENLSNQLQQLNQSLEKKVKKRTMELHQANSRLEKMEMARRRLFANVSHELNTPLMFIQGYIKAMLDGVVSKDDSTYLRAVYRDTNMMAHMIKDLQMLSKLESGHVTFSFESVDINSFINEWIHKQQTLINNEKLTLHFQNHLQNKIICLIDPVRIEQAMVNLLYNAVKFTPNGTIIVTTEMDTSKQAKHVRITFTDTGFGIKEEDIPYIFERFYKSTNNRDTEKIVTMNSKADYSTPDQIAATYDGEFSNNESNRGAGLGLAIVKEIIEQHNGTIHVFSEFGKGSTFDIRLPITQGVEKSE